MGYRCWYADCQEAGGIATDFSGSHDLMYQKSDFSGKPWGV